MSQKRKFITFLACVGIVGIGVLICFAFIWTAPQTAPEEKVRAARIVQFIEVVPSDEHVFVSAFGTVIPARQVEIKPQVRGRVFALHPSLVPGGSIDEGEELIRIDAADYQIALADKETALEEAKLEFSVEKGRQVIAAREWDLLERDLTESEVDRSLVLREPHLRKAEAIVRRANSEIERAKLDMDRTSVTAPFNAMVLEETVELGQLAEPGGTICTLVGTDEFWIQTAIPFEKLRLIQLPTPNAPGAEANVTVDIGESNVTWSGRIVRLLSDLDPGSRMARVIISIPDPLGLKSAEHSVPLLIGSYVEVDIDAGTLKDVITIPRSAIREGEKIWVVDSNNELQIRDTDVLSSRADSLLISNTLSPGERLIVSNLRTALPGMKVNPQPATIANDNLANAQ